MKIVQAFYKWSKCSEDDVYPLRLNIAMLLPKGFLCVLPLEVSTDQS